MPRILFHFGELSLKGKNRHLFEKRMARNVRRVLGEVLVADGLHREFGRMVAEVTDVPPGLFDRLALLPGIRNFSLAHQSGPTLPELQQTALQTVQADYGEHVAGMPFRVTTRRSDKRFPLKSPEINYEVGGFLKTELGLAVNLDAPKIDVRVEIGRDAAWIYTRRIQGIGGLPVGSSGKGVVLFSGGIDSPVAAFAMMKRGMSVTLLHCYNSSMGRDFAKIKDLARQLSLYQGHVKLFLVDLEEFQRHAIAHVPAEYRMIIYKRQMIREAAKIAHGLHAQALITGDSLGQVASQTLANIQAIYDASPLPLLSPLIAWDKEEIIALARRIGTFEVSIEEYCDICSFMVAKHPETHARRATVAHLEQALPIDNLLCPVDNHVFEDGKDMSDDSSH